MTNYTESSSEARNFNHPDTIDISMTGTCQLDCPWCWGESHEVGTIHQANAWKDLLTRFNEAGTDSVVFTGGEPLTVPFLPEVIAHAKLLRMRTTLSTNAILLARRHDKVLPFVDDIGLPIDGSVPEINKIMRPGKINNFQRVIDGAKLVLDEYPETELTLRTVIARPNIDDVVNIPKTLSEQGVDIERIRYKMYQVEPIGLRADVAKSEEWKVEEEECVEVADAIGGLYPELNYTLQLYKNTSGRYYQVGPRGNAYGTLIDSNGNPQTVELGNPIESLDHSMAMIALHYSDIDTH